MRRGLDPGVALSGWVLVVAASQRLQGATLAWVGMLVIVLALGSSARRLLSMLRRGVWFLLALVLSHVWMVPGERALPWLGGLSPTFSGIDLALTQAVRVLIALGMVALVMRCYRPHQLAAGLASMASALPLPLQWTEAFGRRLDLTLQLVSTNDGSASLRVMWRDLLARSNAPILDNQLPDRPVDFAASMRPVAWYDRAAVLILLSGALAIACR